MIKSYELLKNLKSKIEIDFDSFEKENNLIVECSFKRFVRNIQLGNDNYYDPNFNISKVYNDDSDFIQSIGSVINFDDKRLIKELVFDRFIENSKLLSVWNESIRSDMLFSEFRLLPIGFLYFPYNTRLFISFETDSIGSIFLDFNEELRIKHDIKVLKINNNIWDFIENLEEILNFELIEKLETKNLYKNWGEDFWRVREK